MLLITPCLFSFCAMQGIVGTDCGTVWYVNWPEHSCVRLVSTNPTDITSIQFSDDGSKFVTCAEDGSLRLWTVDDREQVLQFQVLEQVCAC